MNSILIKKSVFISLISIVSFFLFITTSNYTNGQEAPPTGLKLKHESAYSQMLATWDKHPNPNVIGYELKYCIGNKYINCANTHNPKSFFKTRTIYISGRDKTSVIIENPFPRQKYKISINIKSITNPGILLSAIDLPEHISTQRLLHINIDTNNNRLWILTKYGNIYHTPLDSNGTPLDDWIYASNHKAYNFFIDTNNNRLWILTKDGSIYHTPLDSNGTPLDSWNKINNSLYNHYTILNILVDIKNNKLWIFGTDPYSIYYTPLDSIGLPFGSWNTVDTPTITYGDDSIPEYDIHYNGFIDTNNNKLWITENNYDYELYDNYKLYFISLDSNGVPLGSWTAVDGVLLYDGYKGFIDTNNNKLWVHDYQTVEGKIYYKSLNSNGIPVNDWNIVSQQDNRSYNNTLINIFIDATNNNLWINYAANIYYKKLNKDGTPLQNNNKWSPETRASTYSYKNNIGKDVDNFFQKYFHRKPYIQITIAVIVLSIIILFYFKKIKQSNNLNK